MSLKSILWLDDDKDASLAGYVIGLQKANFTVNRVKTVTKFLEAIENHKISKKYPLAIILDIMISINSEERNILEGFLHESSVANSLKDSELQYIELRSSNQTGLAVGAYLKYHNDNIPFQSIPIVFLSISERQKPNAEKLFPFLYRNTTYARTLVKEIEDRLQKIQHET